MKDKIILRVPTLDDREKAEEYAKQRGINEVIYIDRQS